MNACPKCGKAGRKVSKVTVGAHTLEARRPPLNGVDGWIFCRTSSCAVGYFGGNSDPIMLSEMGTVPFSKSISPERFVCFCFEHTVAAVAEDLRYNSESSIKSAITEACRSGLDECALKNPEGVCCLGNVAAVIRGADQVSATPKASCTSEGQGSCCPSALQSSPPATSVKSGLAAAMGALGAAALSSACCWLPLLLIGLGVSSAGVGAFFDAWRLPLLAASAGLLVLGFYMAYFRKPACESGDACAAPDPHLARQNKPLLWFAALFVAAFAFFPEYVRIFTGDGIAPPAQAVSAQGTIVYTIEGMTCGGCASHAQTALEKLDGVASASVSYEAGEASVGWSNSVDEAKVVAAIKALGYSATRKAGL
jgi:copper chaperone CopZ